MVRCGGCTIWLNTRYYLVVVWYVSVYKVCKSRICIRMFVNFSCFCQLFSSYEHVSAKHQVFRHVKPGRAHWSRSRRDPYTLERGAGAQSVFFGGSG